MMVEYGFSDMVTKGLPNRIDCYCFVLITIALALIMVRLFNNNYDDAYKTRIYSGCLLGCSLITIVITLMITSTRCDIYTNYEIVHLDKETIQAFIDEKIDGHICDYIGDDLYIVSLPNELNNDEEDNK